MPETFPRQFGERQIEEYIGRYDENFRDRLIVEAKQERDENAKSYRGFKVGCSVAVITRSDYGLEELKTYSAANYTPEKKERAPEAKWCAERIVVNLAEADNKSSKIFIPAIVTISSEVDTGGGGVVHDVLHPCLECRNLWRELIKDGTMSEQTKVCSVNDSRTDGKLIIEETTVKDLLAKYSDEGSNPSPNR